jgi:hypothetical protein
MFDSKDKARIAECEKEIEYLNRQVMELHELYNIMRRRITDCEQNTKPSIICGMEVFRKE